VTACAAGRSADGGGRGAAEFPSAAPLLSGGNGPPAGVEQLRVQRASTNAFAESYRIFDQRRAQGIASRLETERAAAALASAAADIPALELAVALTENQLSVLLGRPPGPVARGTLADLAQFPPEIPAGLPGDLLQRRPDVLAAEQSLVAANANIGASFANYFPQLGLTTFMGRVSPELSAFSAGTGNAWNVGATLAGPLFRGGEVRAQYRAAKARFDEAAAAYELAVLRAFQEVANTLVSRQKFGERRVFAGQAATALRAAVDLATQRYLNGTSSYFEVLQAQQELYPAQRIEVQSRTEELNAVILLYRALGGGWQTEAETPEETTP
jgi:multidrug efflux system outer membrane protein